MNEIEPGSDENLGIETDSLTEAVAELYWIELSQFTPRRTALAATARKSGDATTAKAITALRKPTKAAFVVNRLFRSDPHAAGQLGELGNELRKAQRTADAHQMRKLTATRKELVDELTDQAFEAADEDSPTPALREEVAATLKAALADDGVTTLLSHGTLLKSVEWDGFGFPSAPELSVIVPTANPPGEAVKEQKEVETKSRSTVKPQDAPNPETTPNHRATAKPGATPTAKKTSAAADRKARDAQRAKEAAKVKREKEAAAAKERKKEEKARAAAVAKADKVLAMATKAEEELQDTVRRLRDELDTARQDLEKAKETVRRAGIAQRRAAQSLRIVPEK